MVAIAKLSAAVLGITTTVNGFACTPTTPATLSVVLTAGEVYQVENLEQSSWSSLPANLAFSIVKQGIQLGNVTFGITPPATFGFSQVFLLEVQYQDLDTGLVTLPYFNATPGQQGVPFMGPGNSGTAQNTVRQGAVAAQLKAGIAASTGTQVAPTADPGWTGLFLITVAFGATTITAGNIVQANAAPWIPATLPQVPPGVLNGSWIYAQDTGTANAYSATVSVPGFVPSQLVPGMQVRLKIKTTNTGASTFNFNNLGAASILRGNMAALQANDLTAGAVVDLSWDGTEWQISNYLGIGSSPTNNFFSTTGLPYCADSSSAANSIIAPFSPAITGAQMVAGLTISVKLANTTTGPTTITVNSNAAVNVKFPDLTPIGLNDLKAGMVLILEHDGTQFQVVSWHNATSPLKVLELGATTGQTFINTFALQQITSLTAVTRNTLLTSTWSGSAFTCGTGEDGLWSFYAFVELNVGTTANNIVFVRTRAAGGAQEFYWPCGTTVSQPSTTILIDLAVGDTVQLYMQTFASNVIIAQPVGGSYPSLVAYRIEGLH